MSRRTPGLTTILVVQAIVIASFAAAWGLDSGRLTRDVAALTTGRSVATPIEFPRRKPLTIRPLYDRPDLISDDEVLGVLRQVQPRFAPTEMKPNHVEHALRTWSIAARFHDANVRDGDELARFLTDHGSFLESWGPTIRPLLEERPTGVAIRWGAERCASVHHDHWIASLSEAGVALDAPVFGPGRWDATIADVLRESLRDFRLDERETEWTVLAFGLWLPPHRQWTGGDGREYSFDLLAKRLMRGHREYGVCSGTHRAYSLMALLRLDEAFPNLLSDDVQADVRTWLEEVRDLLTASQFPDGHWPSNWADGADALTSPRTDDLSKMVIATGHHLEWLAIAPPDLHPPEEQLRRAFRWMIDTTLAQPPEAILDRYTFFSHVGSAAATWRGTTAWEFWSRHAAGR
ncbi:MAG: hypothetical protein KF774_06765 [Planctomyces sp.]|nr:hypothetical protein [Planctomyces sp.]